MNLSEKECLKSLGEAHEKYLKLLRDQNSGHFKGSVDYLFVAGKPDLIRVGLGTNFLPKDWLFLSPQFLFLVSKSQELPDKGQGFGGNLSLGFFFKRDFETAAKFGIEAGLGMYQGFEKKSLSDIGGDYEEGKAFEQIGSLMGRLDIISYNCGKGWPSWGAYGGYGAFCLLENDDDCHAAGMVGLFFNAGGSSE
jgi:hypothetical protein